MSMFEKPVFELKENGKLEAEQNGKTLRAKAGSKWYNAKQVEPLLGELLKFRTEKTFGKKDPFGGAFDSLFGKGNKP